MAHLLDASGWNRSRSVQQLLKRPASGWGLSAISYRLCLIMEGQALCPSLPDVTVLEMALPLLDTRLYRFFAC